MVKFPYQRLAQVYSELLAESLPQEELARRLAVSTRTVRSDIDLLNTILVEHGAKFILRRNKGYSLQIDDPAQFKKLSNQTTNITNIPHSSEKRVRQLMIQFLNSTSALKLQDLADEWNVSRATLQADMADVRERFGRYQLSIDSKPHYGMKLNGTETAIRVCYADLLCKIFAGHARHPLLKKDPLLTTVLASMQEKLPDCLNRSSIRLSDDGRQFLIFYCVIAVKRIIEGFPLQDFAAEDPVEAIHLAAQPIIELMQHCTGTIISPAEVLFLCVNIAARSVQDHLQSERNADDADALVRYILDYINTHYTYDLRQDEQLRIDLLAHVRTMITRVRYQIAMPNPVLADIKQHYALAFDFTLSAVRSWAKHSPYIMSENEIGYLVLHIGVALERHYQIGYLKRPQVLLVNDGGNATLRTLEAQLRKRFPQIDIGETLTGQDYEKLQSVVADFVVSTLRVPEKNKPVVVVSPFPSDYQLEQLAKLVSVDRTRPYMLERYFSPAHFLVAEQGLTRDMLFERVCSQLLSEGYVGEGFFESVLEREEILSTILGDGIALPHALGLMARKTIVYTIIAPHGILWDNDNTARVIFLLAISKTEYEEAMAIYDLFISFMRQRTTARLTNSRSFEEFRDAALACLANT